MDSDPPDFESEEEQLAFQERLATLLAKYSSESGFISEATRKTKDRLLLISLITIGIITGLLVLKKLSASGAEIAFQSALVMRIGLGLACCYLVCLLAIQVLQDRETTKFRRAVSFAQFIREIDVMRKELSVYEKTNARTINSIPKRPIEPIEVLEKRTAEIARLDAIATKSNLPEDHDAVRKARSENREMLRANLEAIREAAKTPPPPGTPEDIRQDRRVAEISERLEMITHAQKRVDRFSAAGTVLEILIPMTLGAIAVLQCLVNW